SSGTEAVEGALKLGRAATGRSKVVSCEHGFHGLTLGSLSAAGDAVFSERFGPLLPGFSRVPFDDLEALEAALRGEDVAVFIVEPVQGHGPFSPSPGYLEGAQELCRRYGTLFCVDEVQTGFGRTGRMFALDHFGLEPDLVTVAKALSGGYVPIGALELGGPPGGSRSWRMLERVQTGLFAQLVVVPLFSDHKILTQVAGHDSNVIKILPPLVLSEADVDWFVGALDETLQRAQKLP